MCACVQSVEVSTFDTSKFGRRETLYYGLSLFFVMVGVTYASVPLYRVFCQAIGAGGQASLSHDTSGKIAALEKCEERLITVVFNADIDSRMRWNFEPIQSEIMVYPGETALAFFTAKNPTDKPIVGISTYNIVPYTAGPYFNKIQCFCFDEQILNPNEQVDLPVFFYIDPEYLNDPFLDKVDSIVLSYTFFEAAEGQEIPLPGFMTKTS